MINKPELLAPAGGAAALCAAVQSGADAVYLGADKFSARSGADNFTLDTLGKWIDYCHLRGVRVHLAANTLIKENEREEFLDYVTAAYRMGIDALIIQDLGMAARVRECCPELSLHASTQMTVSTAGGVRYLQERGFDRVVLARELTFDEIADIRSQVTAELEVFAHGALCFCYSGQCLMSSIIGQRSGNRGMCAQPCRLPYELMHGSKGKKKGYLLSPKDLCLAERIGELSKIGINSLKIEGRLKSANYVATVAGVYRKIIDGRGFTAQDEAALMGAFNRSGFTEGWYGGGKNMMSGSSPSNKASNIVGAEYAKYTEPNANFRKIDIDIYAELHEGGCLSLTMLDADGNCAAVCGEIRAERAKTVPLTEQRLLQQLTKLGFSVFSAKNTEIILDDGISLPISEINNVRRAAAEELARQRISGAERKVIEAPMVQKNRTAAQPYITAVCMNTEQAHAAAECGVKRIAAPHHVAKKLGGMDAEVVTLLGAIGEGKAATESVMAMNTAQIKKFDGKSIYGGFRLNVMNSDTAAQLDKLCAITLSPELNLKEIRHIATKIPCEVFAYGRLPLMVMRNCPARACGCCSGSGGYTLRDRRGEEFRLWCSEGCTSELLNSKPIYMADKMHDIAAAGVDGVQLWFHDESAAEVKKVVAAYQNGAKAEENSFTRGHFYRGVV